MPTSELALRELETAQPILFIRRSFPREELQQHMAECWPALFGYAQEAGLAMAGQPIARYQAMDPEGDADWTVDFVLPLAEAAASEGEMQSGSLATGTVAFAVHEGGYDSLGETHEALRQFVAAQGHDLAGATWESYVTDPGQFEDPADWRTEVYWPLG